MSGAKLTLQCTRLFDMLANEHTLPDVGSSAMLHDLVYHKVCVTAL